MRKVYSFMGIFIVLMFICLNPRSFLSAEERTIKIAFPNVPDYYQPFFDDPQNESNAAVHYLKASLLLKRIEPDTFTTKAYAEGLSQPIENISEEAWIQIEDILTINREALVELRKGISSKWCRMPDMEDWQTELSYLAACREFARELIFEGNIYEKKGEYINAIQRYLDVIKLCTDISHNGVLINKLVETAIKDMVLHKVYVLLDNPKIDVSMLKNIANELEKLQDREVSYAQAINEELAVTNRSLKKYMTNEEEFKKMMKDAGYADKEGLDKYSLAEMKSNLLKYIEEWNKCAALPFSECIKKIPLIPDDPLSKALVSSYERALLQIKKRQTDYKVTILKAYLQTYQTLKGCYPNSLNELIPAYATELPKDPFSEKDFYYIQASNGWIIYSVGADLEDNRGELKLPSAFGLASKGDLVYTNKTLLREESLCPISPKSCPQK